MAALANINITVKDSNPTATQWNLTDDINGRFTFDQLLKFTKTSLIGIAKETLREEQTKGFDKKPTVIVDNKFNTKEENVKPFGKIEYIARTSLKPIVREIYRTILRLSPVLTGRYFNNNVVVYNNKVVARTPIELESWLNSVNTFNERDKIRFQNEVPYARKLERIGRTRTKRQIKRVTRKRKKGGRRQVTLPNGAYAQAFNLSRRRFGKNIFIDFDILPGPRLGINNPDYKFKTGRAGQIGKPYLFPSIILDVKFSGLTDAGNGVLQ
jgi:hypothetical protein